MSKGILLPPEFSIFIKDGGVIRGPIYRVRTIHDTLEEGVAADAEMLKQRMLRKLVARWRRKRIA